MLRIEGYKERIIKQKQEKNQEKPFIFALFFFLFIYAFFNDMLNIVTYPGFRD
jgi:hypothetical protein